MRPRKHVLDALRRYDKDLTIIDNKMWRVRNEPHKRFFIVQELPGTELIDEDALFYRAIKYPHIIFGIPSALDVDYRWFSKLHERKTKDTRNGKEFYM